MPDRGPVNRVPERFAEGNSGLSVPEKGRRLEVVLLLKDDQGAFHRGLAHEPRKSPVWSSKGPAHVTQ